MEKMGGYFLLVLSVAHFVHAASVGEYKSYENYKLYTVESGRHNIERLFENMKEYEFQEKLFYEGNRTATQVLVAPELTSLFQNLIENNNMRSQLIIEDFSQIILMEKTNLFRGQGFSWTAYYDIDDINKYLTNMSRTFPESTKLVVGGKSYEGRQLLGLRINTPGTRTDGKDKPVMFIESGIHAREWITPATTTYFINELLHNTDPQIQGMRDNFDWHIFPVVNPDGYHYSYVFNRMWRKTRSRSPNGCRGADPNRNWDYNWLQHGSSSNPCDSQTYAGSKPFSEIETRTLSEYIAKLENLQGYVSFHADAQMLLVPYSDSTEHTDNYDDLVTIGKKSLQQGYQVNGEEYQGPATAAELLYKASGGSMDWVRNKLGTPLVYTYELRGRYFHWPPSRISEQGDEVTQMMLGLVQGASSMGYFEYTKTKA